MPIHAVALLRLDPSRLRAQFPDAPESDEGFTLQGPRGPVRAVPIEDGVHLHLAVPFDTPPRELGLLLRQLLGASADAHSDPRGVYVYPDIARSDATTYEGVVADLGEGGMWVRLARAEQAERAAQAAGDATSGPDLFSAVQGLMTGDVLAQVQAALADPSGDPMASLAGLASKLLEDPALRETVQSAASALVGSGQLPDPSRVAPSELLAQAQALAGQLGAERPDLVAGLTQQLGGAEEE